MQYVGGKSRTARRISEVIRTLRGDGQTYLEPFVGACNVLQYVDGKRIAGDMNRYVVLMWKLLFRMKLEALQGKSIEELTKMLEDL